ncbi:MAG TPA: recombination mediator RecR [Candidatus Kapabacteria bacterium]|nr:recombination mediator RecR [Candidatus Kapabacteria bacterium]
MQYTSESIEKLVELFSSLPTIGRKTAQRLTFHLLRQSNGFVEQFANAMLELKKNVKYCSVCHNFTDTDPCPICSSHKRDKSIICVVEQPSDVMAIEKTNEFFGLYHVLHGVLNPLENIGPTDIKIKELIERLQEVNEVILAINPSIEGEATIQYIARIIKPIGIKITRIARGIPMGAELEFTDEATITRAIEGRCEI